MKDRSKSSMDDMGAAGKQPSARKVGILVAGMHRSGTSPVARMLNILGCALPQTLMAPHPSNEKGFWESPEIVKVNSEILVSAGSTLEEWRADEWREFDSRWYASPVAESFRARAREVLVREFGDSPLFVIKDPRLCRLLPFWIEALEAFGAQPLVVSPIRNPLDVAESLEARDGIASAIGMLMWLQHVLSAEAESRGVGRVFLRYEHLLSKPHEIADRLNDVLGIAFPRRMSDVDAEIDEFLSRDLRHHRTEDVDVFENPRLSDWIRTSFAIFNRWSSARERKGDRATLNRIKTDFDEAMPAFDRAVAVGLKTTRWLSTTREEIAQRNRQLDETQAGLTERHEQLQATWADLTERDGQLRASRLDVAERDNRLRITREELAQRNTQLDETRAELAQRNTQLDETRAELAQRNTQLDETRAELAQRNTQLDETRAELTQRNSLLHASRLHLAERNNRLRITREELAQRNTQLDETRAELAQRNRQLDETRAELAQRDLQLHAARIELAERSAELDRKREEMADRERQIAEWNRTVADIMASRSWRVTRPLRAISAGVAYSVSSVRSFARRARYDAGRFWFYSRAHGPRAACRRTYTVIAARMSPRGSADAGMEAGKDVLQSAAAVPVASIPQLGSSGDEARCPAVAMLVADFHDGGLEKVVVDLAGQLRRQGIDCPIMVLGSAGRAAKFAEEADCRVRAFNGDVEKLVAAVREEGVEIVVLHHCYEPLERLSKLGVKLVEVIHNAYSWQRDRTQLADLRSKCIGRFVAVSDFVRDYSIANLSIAGDRIEVIENGLCRHGLIRPPLGKLARQRTATVDRPVLVHLANAHPQKSHIAIVRAFEGIIENHGDAELVLAGTIDDSTEIGRRVHAEIEQRDLNSHVRCSGPLGRREISRLLANAHVGLLPSVFEGFSIASLEYAYFALPTILSDTGAARRLADRYEHAVLARAAALPPEELDPQRIERRGFDPDPAAVVGITAAMATVLANYDQFADKARHAGDDWHAYSIESVARQYRDLLNEALS